MESTVTMQAFMKRLEEAISANSGGFLGSAEAPGAADYLVWPWLERLSAIMVISPGTTAVGQGRVGGGGGGGDFAVCLCTSLDYLKGACLYLTSYMPIPVLYVPHLPTIHPPPPPPPPPPSRCGRTSPG